MHVTGENDEAMPPTTALLRRGLVRNVEGYSIFGKLSEQNPGADIVHAVADKDIDVAVVWGPLGGYFAEHSSQPLEATPVCAAPADHQLPLSFDISMGVRPGNESAATETKRIHRSPPLRDSPITRLICRASG